MHKKFNLCDVILSVICVVFVAEATAPVASLGNTQFFWRIFMIVLHCQRGIFENIICKTALDDQRRNAGLIGRS